MTNPPLVNPPSSPSFSSLPDEIIVNCLARISRSHYRSLSLVSKSFLSLISSLDLYVARSQIGAQEPCLYLCLRSPTDHRWFTLDQTLITNGGEIEYELTLVPIKRSSSPSQSTTVAIGSEIYQIGGTEKRTKAVRILDCRNHTWRDAPNMKVARKRAKCFCLEGKLYVMGGCKRSKQWGEVFDVKTQTWKPLPNPSYDGFDPNHKVEVFGGKLYIITKYYKYGYDPKEGRWVREARIWDLERLILTRPWCDIENLMFFDLESKYRGYDPVSGKWLNVLGLGDLYTKRARDYRTLQLVNYGGKLVIIWEERIAPRSVVWCAVIKLEKRSHSYGYEVLGVIERSNVVLPKVPNSYKLSTCLSVSV